jgi:Zn-dependent peptidase ImmA (M78 family)
MGLPDSTVDAWEAREASPTISQLRDAARVYKRPLAVFFMSEPPTGFDVMRDFRRHEDAPEGEWSPALHGEYRRALSQREYALELSEIDERPPELTWRLSEIPEGVDELAGLARTILLGSAPLRTPVRADSPYIHLNYWISALESNGVLILATSGGGVSVKEMRAFSIYADQFPVIVVNGKDGPRGRLFSLLHEYAHLLLHTSGLCDTVADSRATTPNRILEAKCNAIAASILMPEGNVRQWLAQVGVPDSPYDWNYETLREAAAPFGASAEAFLRRLVTLGLVPERYYSLQRETFLRFYERDEASSRKRLGGNFYRNKARDLGKGYVRSVADAHRRQVIDSYTAASYLGVKVGQIPELAQAAALKEVA